MYLAEKTGKLMPKDVERGYVVIQWLMFQMGGIGPMLGQANHFRGQAPDNEYLAGEYSIADIACYPWLQGHEKQGQNLNDFPHVKRWFEAVTARPGVQRGLQVMADVPVTPLDDKAREIMYGAKQYERR